MQYSIFKIVLFCFKTPFEWFKIDFDEKIACIRMSGRPRRVMCLYMYKPIFPNLKYLDVSIFHYELALGLRLSCLAYLCMLRPKTTLSWDYFLTGIIFKNRNMRGLPVAISFNYFIFMIAITWWQSLNNSFVFSTWRH